MHKGLDIKVYIGDTIVAAFDGKVRMVGYEASGYGNYVVIRHARTGNNIWTPFKEHCKRRRFRESRSNDRLGGNTGRSFGSHLHFETRIVGVAIDPSLLFDFRNQDVTCNTFTFRYRDCDGGILSRATMERNHQEVAQAVPTGRMYQVEGRRVSVQSVAEKLGLTVEALCDLNGFTQGTVLTRGQWCVIDKLGAPSADCVYQTFGRRHISPFGKARILPYLYRYTHPFVHSFAAKSGRVVVLFDLLLREVKSGVRVNSVRELVLPTGDGQSQLPTH